MTLRNPSAAWLELKRLAEEYDGEMITDPQPLYRVVWEDKRGSEISTHELDSLSVEGDSNLVRGIHVTGDTDYWIRQLEKDYDRSARRARIISIRPKPGDVLIPDVQYMMHPDGGMMADSHILLTPRRRLRYGVDWVFADREQKDFKEYTWVRKPMPATLRDLIEKHDDLTYGQSRREDSEKSGLQNEILWAEKVWQDEETALNKKRFRGLARQEKKLPLIPPPQTRLRLLAEEAERLGYQTPEGRAKIVEGRRVREEWLAAEVEAERRIGISTHEDRFDAVIAGLKKAGYKLPETSKSVGNPLRARVTYPTFGEAVWAARHHYPQPGPVWVYKSGDHYRIAEQEPWGRRRWMIFPTTPGSQSRLLNPRYYHGSAASFGKVDPARFDPQAWFGPGYYLTDDPRVASSYATTRADQVPLLEKRLVELEVRERDLRKMRPRGDTRRWERDAALGSVEISRKQVMADLAEARQRATHGPNVRAVQVPDDLDLLDIDRPITHATAERLARTIRGRFETRPFPSGLDPLVYLTKNLVDQRKTIHEALAAISNQVVYERTAGGYRPLGKLGMSGLAQLAGYDGIRYQGGSVMPIRDEQGRPISHNAVVIFPKSLGKLENALSRTREAPE